jgi:hypothetical protein
MNASAAAYPQEKRNGSKNGRRPNGAASPSSSSSHGSSRALWKGRARENNRGQQTVRKLTRQCSASCWVRSALQMACSTKRPFERERRRALGHGRHWPQSTHWRAAHRTGQREQSAESIFTYGSSSRWHVCLVVFLVLTGECGGLSALCRGETRIFALFE